VSKMYVVRTENSISEPMTREEAVKMARIYDRDGVSAYIVSEEEGQRLLNSEFNLPKWS
jgi:hypothetical protein